MRAANGCSLQAAWCKDVAAASLVLLLACSEGSDQDDSEVIVKGLVVLFLFIGIPFAMAIRMGRNNNSGPPWWARALYGGDPGSRNRFDYFSVGGSRSSGGGSSSSGSGSKSSGSGGSFSGGGGSFSGGGASGSW